MDMSLKLNTSVASNGCRANAIPASAIEAAEAGDFNDQNV